MPDPVVRKLAWLLKQNRRYAPLLDTGLKLSPLLLPIIGAIGVGLWTTFSGYLGLLGQAPLPLSQAGDWVFLLIFGGAVSFIFVALVLAPAAWTSLVRWNAPAGTDMRTIRQACAASAAAALPPAAAQLWRGSGTPATAIVTATISGGMAGGLVLTRHRPHVATVVAGCIGFAQASLVALYWFVALWLLLAPLFDPVSAAWPAATTLAIGGGLALILAAHIFRPAMGVAAGLLLATCWIGQQASSDGSALVASALYTADLGGGRPAHVDQGKVLAGEVCNLGIDARPVLVFERGGCERKAALTRVRALKRVGSLDRKRALLGWRIEAEKRLRGAHA